MNTNSFYAQFASVMDASHSYCELCQGKEGSGMYSETSIATVCVIVSNSDLLLRTVLGVGVEGEEGR